MSRWILVLAAMIAVGSGAVAVRDAIPMAGMHTAELVHGGRDTDVQHTK